MPHYLIQVACTQDYWGGRVKSPEHNPAPFGPMVEGLGGKLHAAFLAFGKYDAALIVEMPDNISAAALSMAASATAAFKAVETTPLIALTDGLEAAKKAGQIGYRPPA